MLANALRSLVVEDARADPAFATRPSTIQVGIGAYMGVPVYRFDGSLYGTLCTLHLDARPMRDGETTLLHIAGRAIMQAVAIAEAREREAHLLGEAAERERQLVDVTARTRAILERITDAFVALDHDWRFTYVNLEAERLLRHSSADLLGANIWEVFPSVVGSPTYVAYQRAMADGISVTFTAQYVAQGNWFEIHAYPSPDGLSIYFQNITERRRLEEALRRVNRARATVSACNHALVRATSEEELLRRVCQAIVEVGGYRLAWVARPEQDAAKTIRAIASYGDNVGYLDAISVSWDATMPEGRGPIGTAINTGQTCIVQNMRADALFAPWQAVALAAGYAATMSLPLTSNGRTLGALAIYAAEPEAFDAEEAALLAELADDLAYGIAALHSRVERDRAEAAQRVSEEQYRRIVETAQEGIWQVDADHRTTFVNQTMANLLGYDVDAMLGAPVYAFYAITDDEGQSMAMTHAERRRRGIAEQYDIAYRRKDGSVLWARVSANPLRDAQGRYAGAFAMVTNITDRKRAEDDLRHQALHDSLTNLPNRTLLNDRVDQAILLAQRERQSLALLLLDVDGFKEINDTFGHHHGDLLLQQIALRLREALRATDTVARLGGDEFAILLPGASAADAALAAAKVRLALDAPFVVETQPLHTRASVGVALYPLHGVDAPSLLRGAEVAMYVAKRGGKSYAMYEPEQDTHSRERIALVTDLRRACAERQFALHYQPVVDIRTGRLSHLEALARWTHPERGVVRPDVFIALAEETGLIGAVTECVISMALIQCREWRQRGLLLDVAVNLSMMNLRDPRIVERILEMLRLYDVPPSSLRLELTETSIMSDQAQTIEVLNALGAAGVLLSVDDFGTGYSSLAYLKRLPVDEIKIDRSFVMDMTGDETDAVIVRSTISMAHSLGLRVVAEGVETAQAWEMLAQMGCDAAQGYYLSRPVPADELECWLRQRERAAS